MQKINTGIILAAGHGSRMGSYGKKKQKCLYPYMGKPLIFWWIDALLLLNIKKIIIVTGHYSDQMIDEISKQYSGNNIKFVYDSERLGTASTLKKCNETADDIFFVSEASTFVPQKSISDLISKTPIKSGSVLALSTPDINLATTHWTLHKNKDYYLKNPKEKKSSIGRICGTYILTSDIWKNLYHSDSLAENLAIRYSGTKNLKIMWCKNGFRHFASIKDFHP